MHLFFTILIRKGDDWVALRKPAQEKMLRPAVVASYVPLIVGVTNDFINRLRRKGKTDDLLPELMNYTTESNKKNRIYISFPHNAIV